jgi:RNA polymerase sigma factor (sigma-70 family)
MRGKFYTMRAKTTADAVNAAWAAYREDPGQESELWEQLLRLSRTVARSRLGRPDEDAASEGTLRLIEALKASPEGPTKGASFATWASKVIDNGVRAYLRDELAVNGVTQREDPILDEKEEPHFQRWAFDKQLDGEPREETSADFLTDPGWRVEAQERKQHVENILGRLTREARNVAERYLEGKPAREIAKELGLSERAVYSHWEYTLKRLKEGVL